MKPSAARIALIIIAMISPLGAKDRTGLPEPEPGQRIIQAVRTDDPIVIDGRLEEIVWQREGVNGFTQNDPKDGEPATETTEVWIAYDDKAVYVAAFCRDSEPDRILGRLGRRDVAVDSDWFYFYVDPYYDRRSGYAFAVNPSNSIRDAVLSNDVDQDFSWDGVWEWKAAVHDNGWSVEMRIPFDQLRFSSRDEYVWGVNFRRVVKRKNETASLVWVPKSEPAHVSRFARLEGIGDISPGRHLEVVPYVTGRSQFQPAEPGNPFRTGHRFLGNAGLDLKAGLKSNLTLDATVNSDFGQVEVDPAVINLTAYETYYQERRPFFIEGASIFNGFGRGGVYINAGMNWPSPEFFYSRRIGRAPQGYVTGAGHVDVPGHTTILGAAKITGRLGSWNVGFINALTAREFAALDASGLRSKEEVEPLSYFGVFRAQKDIDRGRRGIGIMATGVMRDTANTNLAGIMNQNAFSLAVDGWTFFDANRNYVLGGWIGGTRVEGTPENILRLQRSPLHYYQRPDAAHVELDPSAGSLSGWGGRIQVAKQNAPLMWVFGIGALSPGFDPNDLGFQRAGSDIVNVSFLPVYMWTKPGKIFHMFVAGSGVLQSYDFGGNKVSEAAVVILQGTFRNFWDFNAEIVAFPDMLNNRLTRGGPMAMSPAGMQSSFMLSTDSRRPFILEGGGTLSNNGPDGRGWSAQLAFRWKPASNLSLSIGPRYNYDDMATQWVGRFRDDRMTATYGTRYVFGRIRQQVVSTEVRLDWTFTPALSLQAYLQPFIGVGAYDRFKELARPRSYDYNVFGQNGSTIAFADGIYTIDLDGEDPAVAFSFRNPDFNVKSLRGTIVLRWEFRPGSLLYFVWTQNRADYANPGDLRLRRDMGDLLTAPGDNIFMLKASYRWNM
ncbi:MAG: DUF5916 domain-containing protein [Acidobacteriota bacterium]|nr:DUF5916 domain-containing protein [Acidobacteriota bacterium]